MTAPALGGQCHRKRRPHDATTPQCNIAIGIPNRQPLHFQPPPFLPFCFKTRQIFGIASIYEQNIASAIKAVANGETQAAAAALHDIHPSTLSRRLRGTTSTKASKIDSIRLSLVQETFLVNWALYEDSAGRALSKAQLTRIAQKVLVKRKCFKPLSYR